MASWFRFNENQYINTDNFNMFRVREEMNDDTWIVEGFDLKGGIKIATFNSQLQAQSLLEKLVGDTN